jgi:hypothetical protein
MVLTQTTITSIPKTDAGVSGDWRRVRWRERRRDERSGDPALASGRVIRRLPFFLLTPIVFFNFFPENALAYFDAQIHCQIYGPKLEVTRSVLLPVQRCHKLVVGGLKKARVGRG